MRIPIAGDLPARISQNIPGALEVELCGDGEAYVEVTQSNAIEAVRLDAREEEGMLRVTVSKGSVDGVTARTYARVVRARRAEISFNSVGELVVRDAGALEEIDVEAVHTSRGAVNLVVPPGRIDRFSIDLQGRTPFSRVENAFGFRQDSSRRLIRPANDQIGSLTGRVNIGTLRLIGP